MKILIVDDSSFMRKTLRAALESEPAIQIVGEARDGEQAIELAKALKPDLITLDVEMPKVDGLTALRRIMREAPTRVVIVSSLTPAGSKAALTALKLGAVEVIAKEPGGSAIGGDATTDHVRRVVLGLAQAKPQIPATSPPGRAKAKTSTFTPERETRLVLIGSSTGGPPVLEKIVNATPPDLRPPVVIAQHMPAMFTRSMADRFAGLAAVPVKHLEDGDHITPGAIYICPGGQNTHLKRRGNTITAVVNRQPDETLYFPSVNVLLDSAVAIDPSHTLAAILTGMGEDGSIGAKKLHNAGGTIVAQSKASSVVYGMPKAVTEAAITAASLDPDEIAGIFTSLGAAEAAQAA